MFRKNSRAALLVLIAALALFLAACDSGPDDAAAAQAGEQPTPTVAGSATENTNPPDPANSPGVIAALEGTLEKIYADVNPSVVHIRVALEEDAQSPSGAPGLPFPQPRPRGGQGSGFVWDDEGHIVTNFHVVEGANDITVTFADETIVDASVVGTDEDSDLAVLRVDVPGEILKPVQMGDSTEVQVGELVIAIGNPFGQEGSMTVGFVSALGRLLPVERENPQDRYNIADIIQTDAAINPGNSGGVLLDDQGRVIGVTTAIISPAQVSSGIGFAIPSAVVQKVVPALITDGEYEHPYLGIVGTTLTPDLARAMELDATQRGALVIEAQPGGPAADAGIQGGEQEMTVDGRQVLVGGDVITAIAGDEVRSMDDLITNLARYGNVGEQISLTVLRDGQEQQVSVTLAARPEDEGQLPERSVSERAWMGILGTTVATEIASEMELPSDQDGVLVVQVVADGPADEAGLRESTETAVVDGQEIAVGGDVIIGVDGHPVPSMQILQGLLAQYAPGDEIILTVLRDGQEVEVSLTLAEAPQ